MRLDLPHVQSAETGIDHAPSAGKLATQSAENSLHHHAGVLLGHARLRRHGIQVVLIEPGDFATGFTAARIKQVSDEAAAAYPSLHKSVSSFEKDERTGLKPEYLARKVAKIVRKKHPKFRYVIATFIQKLSIPLKRILPARTFVRVLSLFYQVK
mgnify:CR=1 FL=1